MGSGPAGAATGMALAALAPRLAERTLCIDKQTHPREKICGGGLTGHMLDQMEGLGVGLGDVPSVRIDRCTCVFRSITHAVPLDRPFRVVRRDAFDAHLARTMVSRGIELSEGEAYVSHRPRADGRLDVTTTRRTYAVKALVAADGAGSKIARSIGERRRQSVHLAQADVPMPDHIDRHAMVYDFSDVTGELHGYLWIFPTPLWDGAGRQLCNVGVMQCGPTRTGGGLTALLARGLSRWGMDLGSAPVRFHPEWAFDPGFAFSAPGVLTAGDAAGIDPLFGEGLSQCLEYGRLCAEELTESLSRGDTRFDGYRRRVLWSEMGLEMQVLRIPARRFYRPGNEVWVSFVFNSPYLPRMMAAQGENRLRLHRRVLPILGRAAWHVLAGNRGLPAE